MPISAKNDEFSVYSYNNVEGRVLAVDITGKYVLFGGQKLLYLLNLDERYNEKNTVPLKSKQKSVENAIWSTHSSDAFVTSSKNVIDLWESQSDKFEATCTFQGHQNSISGLDWSPVCTNYVASCSSDGFTYVLDTRDFRNPCITKQTLLPPTRVKWNKVNHLLLATSHECGIEIWDIRNMKEALPFNLINAHTRIINDIDWSPQSKDMLISCGMDSCVKIWNVQKQTQDHDNNSLNPNRVVTRIKFTPTGECLVIQCQPQRDGPELFLWKIKDCFAPKHDIQYFPDSTRIGNYCFRSNDIGSLQLLSWTDDHVLKFWKISSRPYSLCERAMSLPPPVLDKVDDKLDSQRPKTLEQELNMIDGAVPYIRVERKSIHERYMRIVADVRKDSVRMDITFPEGYPTSKPPSFDFLLDTTLNRNNQFKLKEELENLAASYLMQEKCCLEACLKLLVSFLEQLTRDEHEISCDVHAFSKERLRAENVPFPRTSGARFCGPGFLVCFTRRMWMEVDDYTSPNADDDEQSGEKKAVGLTPRAMSALADIHVEPKRPPNYVNLAKRLPTDAHIPSISLFFAMKEPQANSKSRRLSKMTAMKTLGPVIIYDLSCLLPIQKHLGENYVFYDDPYDMCITNAEFAQGSGRKDLHQLWMLLKDIAAGSFSTQSSFESKPRLILTPFGELLIKKWFDHYSLLKDVQTLAMMCCVFSHLREKSGPSTKEVQPPLSLNKTSPALNVASQKAITKGQRKHSNSLSEVPSNTQPSSKIPPLFDISTLKISFYKKRSPPKEKKFVDFLLENHYNDYIKSYANILFQWGFINKRAELLHSLHLSDEEIREKEVKTPKEFVKCTICHLPVKGQYVQCFMCEHGGHLEHMFDWFNKHDDCPTGCGCCCAMMKRPE